jgi:hypothetical protein
VAAGDVNGDGKADVIAAANGLVSVYSGSNLTYGFQPFAGASGPIAASDLDRDGHADIVAASGNFVKVFSGASGAMTRFFNTGAGVRAVAAGDGLIATADSAGIIRVFNALTQVGAFWQGPSTTALAIGDGLIVAAGQGVVRTYDAHTFAAETAFAPFTDVTGVAVL